MENPKTHNKNTKHDSRRNDAAKVPAGKPTSTPRGAPPMADTADQVTYWSAAARTATTRRDHYIHTMRDQGASLRAIAEAAGLTHAGVAHIVNQRGNAKMPPPPAAPSEGPNPAEATWKRRGTGANRTRQPVTRPAEPPGSPPDG